MALARRKKRVWIVCGRRRTELSQHQRYIIDGREMADISSPPPQRFHESPAQANGKESPQQDAFSEEDEFEDDESDDQNEEKERARARKPSC